MYYHARDGRRTALLTLDDCMRPGRSSPRNTKTQRPGGAVNRRRRGLLVVLLLGVHVALGLSATVDMSTSCDEIAHLTAGYSYWRTGDFRLVPEHPPLAQLWAALPLNFMGLRFPSLDQPSWWTSHQWRFGEELFYELGNDPQRMLFAGRAMITLLSAALGLTVFAWSSRLFGPVGGLISLCLYVFCPTMLANGSLVTTDMAVGLFFLLACLTVWKALHRVGVWTILWSGLALGGLFLSKMSAFLIGPIYVLLLFVRMVSPKAIQVRLVRPWEVHGRMRRLAVHAAAGAMQALIVVAVIWMGHGLRYEAMKQAVPGRDHLPVPDTTLPEGVQSWEEVLKNRGVTGGLIDAARQAHLLPEAYLYGFAFALDMTRGSDAFLDGRRSADGFTEFFPLCFLYKTTSPCMVILLIALVVLAARVQDKPGQQDSPGGATLLYELAPLLALLVVYWASALLSRFNIGHRHLLPIYPPLFIMAGVLGPAWHRRRTIARLAIGGGLMLHAAASISVWPCHLSFFNVLAGGPAGGYRHLVDSSLDWGQDLLRLSRWLQANNPPAENAGENGRAGAVHLSYMGTGSPEYYGIRATPLPTFPEKSLEDLLTPLTPGLYCISATNLQLVRILPSSGWTAQLESLYQRCLDRVRQLDGRPGGSAASDPAEVIPDDVVVRLRFARLCAALRLRRPLAAVGYSIFVYSLTRQELDEALFGPPPEMKRDNAEGLMRLGDLFFGTGCPELAAEHYRLAIQLDRPDARAHHNLGIALGKRGRLDDCIAELRESLRLEPDFAEAHENLANALSVAGRLDEAASHYQAAIRLRPRRAELYARFADLLVQRGQPEVARDYYHKASRLRPLWAEPHAGLAGIHARQGDWDGAIREYREAIRLRPNWTAMYNILGMMLAERGDLRQSAVVLAESLRLSPGQASAHVNLADVLLQLGELEGAARHYREALRLEPNMNRAEAGLGRVMERQGRR